MGGGSTQFVRKKTNTKLRSPDILSIWLGILATCKGYNCIQWKDLLNSTVTHSLNKLSGTLADKPGASMIQHSLGKS